VTNFEPNSGTVFSVPKNVSKSNAKKARPAEGLSICLAAELRAESARRGITQTQIAVALNRSNAYINERWHGYAALTVDELALWCAVLEMEPAGIVLAAQASKIR